MSDSDALLWNNERDPMLRSTLLAMMVLDAEPDAARATQAVERMFGFGPLSGAALNVTLFSYDGSACFAIHSDPAAVPDPEFLTECLGKGVAEVLSVG